MGKKVCFLCIIKATRCFSVFTLTKNSADVKTVRRRIPFWQYAQNLSNYGG